MLLVDLAKDVDYPHWFGGCSHASDLIIVLTYQHKKIRRQTCILCTTIYYCIGLGSSKLVFRMKCYCHPELVCGRGEGLTGALCLKTVAGMNKDMLPVKHFRSKNPLFGGQLNITVNIRLSQG